MKKVFTKSFGALSFIILFVSLVLPAKAQYASVNVETGGLYTALAKDASNNIYVTRVKSGTGGATYEVVKYTNGTGTPVSIYSGLTHELGDYPWGLAVTTAGDVYVSTDFTSLAGAVIKLAFNSGANTYTPSTFMSGKYYAALAIDASNNLYTTQYDAPSSKYQVVKYPANSTSGTVIYGGITSGAGYSYPTGLAVAPNGDVFVTDAFGNDPSISSGGKLTKLTAPSYTVSTLSTGNYASALGVDPAGNLYSSENSGSGYKLVKYTGGAGTSATIFSPLHSSGIYYPWGIAAISTNSIFAIDGDNGTNGGALLQLAPVNANLSNLTLSSGTLTPVFAAGTVTYTASVSNATTSITATPTVSAATSTVTVNTYAVTSGTASPSLSLNVGDNLVTVKVMALGGVTKTYKVTVTRAQSPDAHLSNLAISVGTLTPVFATGTTSYTASVTNATTTVKITPTVSVAGATVTVNGTAVPSGTASGSVALNTGPNVITTKVTALDGVSTMTYTVTVTRALSANANLSALFLSGTLGLNPDFAAGTTTYTTTANNINATTKITPTTSDPNATVTVNGVAVASGAASNAQPLVVGTNLETIKVTAQNGTVKTYKVTVTRLKSSNANLSNLTVSAGTLKPVFVSATTTYADTVLNTVTSIMLTPTVAEPNATVTINGTAVASGAASAAQPLVVGNNTMTIKVTAQDSTVKTYHVTVKRSLPANANLSNLVVSVGTLSPAFSSGTTFYNDTVSFATVSIKATPTVVDPAATITVNGVAVASGATSSSIPLNVGDNKVSVVVTAQDGVTVRTYAVTVTRIGSANANLSNLTITYGTLTPAFASATTNYTDAVTSSQSAVNVTPTASEPNATITVNAVAVASGTSSQSLPLVTGSNLITIKVTAQDGITVKTYKITVTRAAGFGFARTDIPTTFNNNSTTDDGLAVHQGVSPNGDGQNDFLIIDGISAYPDNALSIMDRSGQLVFETAGYDNATKIFDGRSNKNGKLQQAGTYFYSLQYKVGTETKHKTGYIILKY